MGFLMRVHNHLTRDVKPYGLCPGCDPHRLGPTWLMVVPAIDSAQLAGFLATCRLPHEAILIVDNAAEPVIEKWDGRYHREGRNLGVAGSWNVGAEAVLDEGLDWLVIASTSFRFGPDGGRTFIEALRRCDNIGQQGQFGWHLIAIHRHAFETVGLFDADFWPAYWEETDFLYRLGLAGLPSPRENGQPWCWCDFDGDYGEQAATLKAGLAPVNLGAMQERYRLKWGGAQGEETYRTPWGHDRVEA